MKRCYSQPAMKLDHRDAMDTEKDISEKLPRFISVFIASL